MSRANVLPTFDAASAPQAIAEALAEVGGVVISMAVPAAVIDRADDELAPYLERVPFSEGYFMGRRTKRTSRLIAKSQAARELVQNALVLESVDRLLRPYCYNMQLHSTMAVRIHPGETAQSLHRDDNVFPLRHPGPPISVNAIWAIDSFSTRNGGTRVVPRSHLWDDERAPQDSDGVAVEMERGSVLLFDTALYHGGGANRSETSRCAVLFAYSQGWVRQLENQFLAVPPDLARTLTPELRALVGYQTHGFLGMFESRSPEDALVEDVPDVLQPRDLYTPELQAHSLIRR